MQWIKDNAALFISIAVFIIGTIIYFTGNYLDRHAAAIGFGVIGILFLLIWIGSRGKR